MFFRYLCTLFNDKISLIFSLQTVVTNLSSKKKKKSNNDIIILAAMKMPEAKLCHLLLGFCTSHKPNPFYYSDTTNFSISLSIHTGLIVVLSCGHTYHKVCYDNNGFKYSYCLSFLQDGVDKNVQFLLTRLQQFDKIKVEKDDDNILCDDDDENEPVGSKTFINDNKNNKICFNCKQPEHFARNCKAPREVKSRPLATRKSQNTRIFKRTRVFKCKEKKPEKVACSEEDETHRQTLIKCAKAYAKAKEKVLFISGTSVVGDIQYAEALVVGRILIEFSNLTTKLHQELNYDFYWAVNETSKILSKVLEIPYDDDDLEDYNLRERDISIESR
ncbi:205_t:CDS:2 [Funneliformis caledonium]|uniref:205_t:CDS:1 n=1 Tax=Funneliformis caledonium TaxID=1117310 RepID=A0A9N9FN45_9GLOM|nr:205_t:CDS:2 [Funneliformis caledonium]